MLRDILTNKGVLAALVFFVLIVGGTQLYSWHVRRSIKADEARIQQFVQQLENKKEQHTAQHAGEATETPEPPETFLETDAKQPMSDEKAEFARLANSESLGTGEAFLPDDMTLADEEETAEVRVSPHGFGPYPEIPEGAPIGEFDEKENVEWELLRRVAIKKWNEGERFLGSSMSKGRVYLHYPNTLYIKWGERIDALDGTVYRHISRAKGAGDVELTPEQMERGEIPQGIKVIDFDSGGLDPYEVLDLP